MALPVLKPVTRKYAWAFLADSSLTTPAYAVAPCKGEIKRLGSVIYNAFSTADEVVTTAINGTTIVGGTITITQSGSAAGDVDFAIPTARATATVKENDAISFTSNGAGTTATPTMFWAEIEMD